MRSSVSAILLVSFALIAKALPPTSIEDDVAYLASDRMSGRVTGTMENEEVRKWIIDRLTSFNVRPAGNVHKTSFRQSFKNRYSRNSDQEVAGTNVIGIIYPQNVWSEVNPRVVIGAHFDHTDHCERIMSISDNICNGAADNATSVAILVSMARHLSDSINSPVAITFWDAEEVGLLGSDAFLKNPSFDLSEVNAYLNLDIVGLNLYKGLENHHLIMGSETGGIPLEELVRSSTVAEGGKIQYHQLSYAFGHGRSDMSSFFRHRLQIPTIFFSDGDGTIYHTNKDETALVNFEKVHSVSRVLREIVVRLSKLTRSELSYQRPTVYFDKGSLWEPALKLILKARYNSKTGIPMPRYEDVAVVEELYAQMIQNQSSNQRNAEATDQALELRRQLIEIRDDGSRSFSIMDKFNLLKAAAYFTHGSKSGFKNLTN